MAFKWSSANSDKSPAMVRVAKTTETAMAKGDALAVDITNNALERAVSTSTVLTMRAVCMETRVAGDADVLVILIDGGQLWEADTTNNTHATNQTYERCALTDHVTVNNSGTDVSTHAGAAVGEIIAPIGAVGDRKILWRFYNPQVVTA